MKIRHRRSPLVLLLLSSLAATTALAAASSSLSADSRVDDSLVNTVQKSTVEGSSSSSSSTTTNSKAGTKDAPVDGKDGRPHEGPFVEVEKLRHPPSKDSELPLLKNKPADANTIHDGAAIPQSGDGVMDDKNRPEPKKGSMGTSGGVTEKDKVRKAKEGATGEKTEKKPETPKESPPLSHAEQDKVGSSGSGKPKADDAGGLEKPSNLPDKIHDKSIPLPNSANKDHLDLANGRAPVAGGHSGSTSPLGTPEEGIIQPFHSFVLSLTMILVSEVGDKTFLVAALMAMKHDRLVVFSAAFSALITMTVLSAVLGHALPTLIPKKVTNFLAGGLFLVFGAKLLREGLAMDPDEGVGAEMAEVELELEEKEIQARKMGNGRRRSSISPYALEMGIAGNGNNNNGNGNGKSNNNKRTSRSQSRFPTPPRSPSSSPDRSPSPTSRRSVSNFMSGAHNLFSLLLSPAWVQTFVMTFLGEWGDRSQIATIAMAAGQDYWWVTLGAVLGHMCCTGVAVIGGRAIAGRVSMRLVTIGGAVAFLVFGVIYFVEAFLA